MGRAKRQGRRRRRRVHILKDFLHKMFLLRKSNGIIQNSLRLHSKIAKMKSDPGIRKRRNVFADHLDTEEINENLDLDDFESDFMNIHKTHREHTDEMKQMDEKMKYLIVRQKYFKEKTPNFLTWHDKEQMKYLHATDPEEWTVEKLSESFPALPETVKKIIATRYTKKESKIRNHDASVQRNWESLKNGEMPDLPRELVEHLNKFTNRALNLKPFVIPSNKTEISIKPKAPSDFSEIITSYERLKNRNKVEGNVIEMNLKKQEVSTSEHKDTFLTVHKSQIRDRRNITLTQLQDNIENKALRGKTLTEDEKIIFQDTKQTHDSVAVPADLEDRLTSQNKYNTSGGALAKKTERDYSHLVYPEKIKIPKNQVKKGYTYRLNDCYYDYDGEFLYRVPGMG